MRLTCPECATVLRPAKPLAVGKRVKCPKCAATFAVTAADEAPEQPVAAAPRPAPPKKKPLAAKPPAPPPRPAKDDDEDGGTYAFVGGAKTPEEEDEGKPKVTYAPDKSVKDLRGPAQEALMQPTNHMIFLGVAGFVGWLVLMTVLLVPVLFPLESDEGTKDNLKPVLLLSKGIGVFSDELFSGGEKKEIEKEEASTSFYQVGGTDLTRLGLFAWYAIIIFMLPNVLGMGYAALQTYGAVRAQNLQSRQWGVASSIMAMVPLTVLGAVLVICMIVGFVLNMIMDDPSTVFWTVLVLGLLLAGVQVGAGVFFLQTLKREEVIGGFAYVPDTDDVQPVKPAKPRRKNRR